MTEEKSRIIEVEERIETTKDNINKEENMMKTLMSILVLIILSTSANAGKVEDKISAVNTWLANEKQTTVEFQKVKWQEGKNQIASTIAKFKKMFNWSN